MIASVGDPQGGLVQLPYEAPYALGPCAQTRTRDGALHGVETRAVLRTRRRPFRAGMRSIEWCRYTPMRRHRNERAKDMGWH
jgi:hypothetical protein